jgi:hypothetical protein
MMKCEEARAFVRAWESGAEHTERTDAEYLVQHLKACASCNREFGSLLPLIMRDAGISAKPDSISKDFVDSVMNTISKGQRERARQYHLSPVLAFAVAAIFVVGISFGFYFGARNSTTQKVTFMLYAPEATSVQLAGDFTSWNPKEFALKKVDGSGMWEIQIPLKKGRIYVYNFIIDGTQWIPDPKAMSVIDDGFGGSSSLLRL